MRLLHLILALALPLSATAQTRVGTDYKVLLLEAVNSPKGTSQAELSGPVADKIRADIQRPQAVVLAEVSTVEKLPQEGCKRLMVRFTTPGTLIPTSDGKSRMLDMNMKLNMCPNGLPPGATSESSPQEKSPPSDSSAAGPQISKLPVQNTR